MEGLFGEGGHRRNRGKGETTLGRKYEEGMRRRKRRKASKLSARSGRRRGRRRRSAATILETFPLLLLPSRFPLPAAYKSSGRDEQQKLISSMGGRGRKRKERKEGLFFISLTRTHLPGPTERRKRKEGVNLFKVGKGPPSHSPRGDDRRKGG